MGCENSNLSVLNLIGKGGLPLERTVSVYEDIGYTRKEEKSSGSWEEQWREIDKIERKMKKDGDRRHIFYLPKWTWVEAFKDDCPKSKFFKGGLGKAVVAFKVKTKGKEHLVLKSLDPNSEDIFVNFDKDGKTLVKRITSGSKAKYYTGLGLDLCGIKTEEQFVEEVRKKMSNK